MRKIAIVAAAVALCGQAFAQGTGKDVEEFKGLSGVLVGPVTAINAEKGEMIVGDRNLIKAGPEDIARFKVGDELTARLHNGELKFYRPADKKARRSSKVSAAFLSGRSPASIRKRI